MPPLKPTEIIKSVIQSEQSADRKEPHMIFMAHDTSRDMKERLEAEGITFEQFITKACLEYIKQQERDKLKAQRYMDFSDMQLTDYGFQPLGQSCSNATEEDSFTDEEMNLKASIKLSKDKK